MQNVIKNRQIYTTIILKKTVFFVTRYFFKVCKQKINIVINLELSIKPVFKQNHNNKSTLSFHNSIV